MMGFLRRCWTNLRALLPKPAAQETHDQTIAPVEAIPEVASTARDTEEDASKGEPVLTELADDQQVSRFLFTTNHFSSTKHAAKTAAFNPLPHQELSVGHTSELDEPAIWAIGETVRKLANRPRLLARADLQVLHITARELKAIRDDEGFPRHTNIKGWPHFGDEDERKRVWKALATFLASKSQLTERRSRNRARPRQCELPVS